MSCDADPVPPCPRCRGTRILKKGYARLRTGPLPTYRCEQCGHCFSRLSGTPLSKRPVRQQAGELIALLPQEISCAEAARQLGVMEHTVLETVRLVRRWLLELDASGHYEPGVRLGGRFTAAQPVTPRLPDVGIAREDRGLSATLTSDFDEIHSPRHDPLPACPACGGCHIRRKGTVSGLPRFRCPACGVQFNRRTGTPFTRNRDAARQRELIRYLGLPLPLAQLADMIDTDPAITARLVDEFRTRCAQLDPSGRLASRIRACVRPATDTPCVWCGACGRLISMRRQLIERDGLLHAGPWQGVDDAPAAVA
ncbi:MULTISPECIES: DUF746 domain-containing protein [Paraburkholderia]|nr:MULTISPECIES: DUF746 domain-containing protein [Paraburkholderia]MCO4882542.1 DUF746 domain-containing protein [Paraburkholderia caribensis]